MRWEEPPMDDWGLYGQIMMSQLLGRHSKAESTLMYAYAKNDDDKTTMLQRR